VPPWNDSSYSRWPRCSSQNAFILTIFHAQTSPTSGSADLEKPIREYEHQTAKREAHLEIVSGVAIIRFRAAYFPFSEVEPPMRENGHQWPRACNEHTDRH
jgi:hypothetical protein